MTEMKAPAAFAVAALLLVPPISSSAPSTAVTAPVSAPTAAMKWGRCSQPTVSLQGGLLGTVLRSRGLSCRRATQELELLVYVEGRLRPSVGSYWYWDCTSDGGRFDVRYYKCRYGKRMFRATVGA